MTPGGGVRRWDVFRADLEPHIGSEQAGHARPVLIISNDAFNRRMPIVTVLPLTGLEGKARKPYPFEILLPPGTVGSGRTSLVMPYQVRTISRRRLLGRVGRVADPALRRQIEDGLLTHLGIEFDEGP